MRWGIALAASILLCASPRAARATIDQGVTPASIGIHLNDGDVTLQGNVYFAVKWKAYVLAGEPVLYCSAAWFISPGALIVHNGKRMRPPASVMAQIRPYNVEFAGEIAPHTQRKHDQIHFLCDLGVFSAPSTLPDPYRPAFEQIPAWAKTAPKKAFSYNTPGSPEWTRTLRRGSGWMTKKAAQKVFKKKITIRGRPIDNHFIVGISKASWNLSAVRTWIAGLEKAKRDKARAARDAQRAARKAKKAARDQKTGKDFWDAPENPDTTAEHDKTSADNGEVDRLSKSAAKVESAATTGRTRYNKWEQAKRKEIANRPKPGADRAIKAGKRVLAIINGPLAHIEISAALRNTRRRWFVHKASLTNRCKLYFVVEHHFNHGGGPRVHLHAVDQHLRHVRHVESGALTFSRNVVHFGDGSGTKYRNGIPWFPLHYAPHLRKVSAELSRQFAILVKACKQKP